MRIHHCLALSVLVISCTQSNSEMNQAPVAKKIPEKLSTHGHARIDNYFWMRLSDEQKEAKQPDQQTKDVLAYLHAENEYLNQEMKHTAALQEKLFGEITSRIKQDDASVPYTLRGYSYYTRFEKGQDYELFCRKLDKSGSTEEVLLNGPELGKGKSYFSLGGREVSPDNKLLVYGVDFVSRRQYTLYFKDLNSGKLLKDKIENTAGSAVWANDNQTIFYTMNDPVTLRSYRIYKHVLGTDQADDQLVYEEKDDTFSCYVFKSKSEQYLLIASHQTLSSEYRFLNADEPNGKWAVVEPRKRDHEYQIEHYGDHFYITSNWNAKNFRLMKTKVSATGRANWEEIIPARKDVMIEDIEIFNDFLVVSERKNGLTELRVMPWQGKEEHYITFNDPAYSVYPMDNMEFNTEKLRFAYTSLTTPNSVYSYDMKQKTRKLLKQQEVVSKTFSPDQYISERHYAKSRDGVAIPVSLVYKKGVKPNKSTPLLLYGYGSYGANMDPYFSSVRLSLLDRGFVFAIAHIRGGQELGRDWYEDGKLLKKKNTFNDFIDCANYLIEKKYTSSKHLYAQGGSAGGLLMGAIINMEPNLWNGVLAGVPFVDVVSTMLDESIPLTTGEFDEWGNPKEKTYYDYMLSYSPYDQIEQKDYPNMLVTTGYWDSQVQYWEPAKWVAKLRAMKTDQNRLYLYCNMDVGHGGASGRFSRFKEVALEYAFLLDLEGIEE